MRFGHAVAPTELAGVPGVEEIAADGTTLRFRVLGDLDPVIKAIAAHQVLDLEVTRPTLEELFLTYYDGRAS